MKPLALMATLSWRFARRTPAQFVVALFGIALGVAAIVAIELSIQSSKRAFALSRSAVVGQSTHRVVGGAQGLDERIHAVLYQRLSNLQLTPLVDGQVRVSSPSSSGERAPVRLLGVDPFAAPAVEGAGQVSAEGAELGAALLELIARPGAVVMTSVTAEKLGLEEGSDFEAFYRGELRRLNVYAVIETAPGQLEGLANIILTDISTAQEVLGMVGRLTSLGLTLQGAEVERFLAGALPETVQLNSVETEAQGLGDITAAFNLNLRMLALLAIVVGAFLIYNTVSFGVTRRRRQLGVLRAMGMRRAEILYWLLGESLLLGAVGTLLGLALGVLLAQVLVGLVSQTINDLYYAVEVRRLELLPGTMLTACAVGIVTALAAGAAPAWQVSRQRPAEVLSGQGAIGNPVTLISRLTLAGATLTAVAAWFLYYGLPQSSGDGLELAFAGLFALVAGAACLAPGVIFAVFKLAATMGGRAFGITGQLALAGASANLSWTALAGAALVVALATTIGVAIMVDSFRHSVQGWLERSLRADIYIGGPGTSEQRAIPLDLLTEVAQWPDVSDISLGHRQEVRTPDGTVSLLALRMAAGSYDGVLIIHPAKTASHDAVWRAFDAGNAVLITEPYANRHGLGPGDDVTLLTAAGPRRFPVLAVYRDYASERGTVLTNWQTLKTWWPRPRITGMGVYLRPGAEVDAVHERIQAALPATSELRASPNRRIKERSLVIFDRTFTVTEALRLVALSVAVCGIFSALLAVALERGRHYANLRAQGMTRGQIFALVELETAIFGLAAGVAAIPLGIVLADILVNVINLKAFGWSMGFEIRPGQLWIAVLASVLAAMLAGLWPARRIANRVPAAVLRGE